jgi:FtsZ-binding cell division protein ZapB
MMVETVVDVVSTHNTAQFVDALIQMEVEQLAHKQQPSQPKVRLQVQLQVRLQQIQQQLEHATQDGVVMGIVMISITTWTVTMMVETVVDVVWTHNTAQFVDALIQMEVEQLAHKQQPSQQLMAQVIMH